MSIYIPPVQLLPNILHALSTLQTEQCNFITNLQFAKIFHIFYLEKCAIFYLAKFLTVSHLLTLEKYAAYNANMETTHML